jgi:hypothetical protein
VPFQLNDPCAVIISRGTACRARNAKLGTTISTYLPWYLFSLFLRLLQILAPPSALVKAVRDHWARLLDLLALARQRSLEGSPSL